MELTAEVETGQQVVRKLELVSGLTCALLHSGDDRDVWQRWFGQQTLPAGRGVGQKRSVVPPGQTLSRSFDLRAGKT